MAQCHRLEGQYRCRTITAGDVGLLRFEFDKDVAFTGYDITINSVGGESVTLINLTRTSEPGAWTQPRT